MRFISLTKWRHKVRDLFHIVWIPSNGTISLILDAAHLFELHSNVGLIVFSHRIY